MSVEFEAAGDLAAVADRVETVQLSRGDGRVSTATHALRRYGATREAVPSAGDCREGNTRWHLDRAEVSERPAPGDAIVDTVGTRWTVLEAFDSGAGGCWQCACRALAIVNDLRLRATIERGTVEKGEQGEPLLVWEVWRSDLPAKLQRVEGHVSDVHRSKSSGATHVLYLEETQLVGHTHRVVVGEQTFAVVGYRKPERIDALMEIEVVEQPWPWADGQGRGGRDRGESRKTDGGGG